MSSSFINEYLSPISASITPPSNRSAIVTPFSSNSGIFDNLLYASFFLLLNAVTSRQNTIGILSKELTSNTSTQQSLNSEIAKISFVVTPDNATQAQITQVQNQNQNYSAQKANLQNLLVTARQTGQTILANTSTDINLLQQLAAQDSAFLNNLSSIGKSINIMNQPSA